MRKTLFVVLLCSCWSAPLFAGVTMDWVKRFNSPGISEHVATKVAADADGNSYVTGWGRGIATGYDYVTIKYYPDGDTAWVRTYTGPGGPALNDDEARDVVADDSGNVYVTGWSRVASGDYDIATIKYDSEGNECWVQRYLGMIDDAYGLALAVDRNGNVYVAGYEYQGNHDDGWVTLKYDPDGNQLWAARYGSPALYRRDRPSAIAVDDSGSVYVTGYITTSLLRDVATVKYNPGGDTAWVRTYNGPMDDWDEALDLAVDDSGNVHVTGYSYVGPYSDYVTIKYRADGDTAWLRTHGKTGDQSAVATAWDGFGNLYVTGSAGTVKYDADGDILWTDSLPGGEITTDALGCPIITFQSEGHYRTVKYLPTGHVAWSRSYDGPGGSVDLPMSLVADQFRNVFVTGMSRGEEGEEEFATLKYDADGSELWVRTYSGPPGYHDYANAIVVGDDGYVYVTGQTQVGQGMSDFATIRYDAAGGESWVQTYNGTGDSDDKATAITFRNGNVYVSGASVGIGTNQDYEYATIKYFASSGNWNWIRSYIGPGNYHDVPTGIAADGSGNVYVTGYSMNVSWTGYDFATIKYGPWGSEEWRVRYDGAHGHDDKPSAMALDGLGNLYITGCSAEDSVPFYNYNYITVKYDTSGLEVWNREYNGPGGGNDEASGLVTDHLGNVFVTGYSHGDGTDHDLATIKYDSAGNELWIRRYNGPGNSVDRAHAIGVDATGNIYVTGSSYGIGTDEDYATIKYDPNGNELWVERYDGPASSTDRAYALAVTSSGYVFATGESQGLAGGSDYATVAYDPNGNQLWVERYNGPGDSTDVPSGIAVDGVGNVFVTGWSFGNETLLDYATVKYKQDYLYGDANGDWAINVADVVYLVNFLYRDGDPPIPVEAGDANCDEIVNIADVVYLVNYLYRGGHLPGCW